MKTKLISMIALMIILSGFASAATSFTVSPGTVTFTNGNLSKSFVITNTGNEIVDFTIPTPIIISDDAGNSATVSLSESSFSIGAGIARTITASVISAGMDSLALGDFSASKTINATGQTSGENATNAIIFNIDKEYCEFGEAGSDLGIDIDISEVIGYGDNKNWYPTDEVKIDITVENKGDDDVDDIYVEWGVYNTRTGEFLIDGKEKRFNLKDGDEKTITVSFKIDPRDLSEDDSEDDFVFITKAYSDDLGEDKACVSYTRDDVKIMRDSHLVIMDKDKLSFPETAECSGIAEISSKIWNIGDNAEDNVYLMITNSQLNINKKVIVGDLDIFDDKTISFEIEIPSGAKEGEYSIKLTLYDENDDAFESDDSKKSEISSSLNIAGKCAIEPSQITAVLQSDAVAGKETTIKATITNKGNSETSYQVLLAGYESWASVKSITPSTFSLKAGQSKDLIIVIVPNSNVGGEKEFAIQAVYNGLVTEQKVSIPIAKSGIGITGWSISELKDSFGNNWFIWAIALFNVILVLIIIIVAIKIARR